MKIIKKLEANPPSAKAITAAHKVMATEAASTATSDKLLEEVDKLAGAAVQIDESFKKVTVALLTVDKNDYKKKDGTPEPKLAPGWKLLQDEWNNILSTSRTTATNAATYCKRFHAFIVPMLNNKKFTYQDKIAELKQFASKAEKEVGDTHQTYGKAVEHTKSFKELREKVLKYSEKFDNFAEDQRILFTNEITTLKAELQRLQKLIKEQEDAIFKVGVTMGATVFGVGANAIGALVAMGPAGPVAAVGIIIAGLVALGGEAATLAGYVRARNEARDEWDDDNKKLQNASAKLEELVKLRTVLSNCKADIDTIAARLDQFVVVWSMVAQDTQNIMNSLKDVEDVYSDEEFKHKVDLMNVSYETLGIALEKYATITKTKLDEEKNKK